MKVQYPSDEVLQLDLSAVMDDVNSFYDFTQKEHGRLPTQGEICQLMIFTVKKVIIDFVNQTDVINGTQTEIIEGALGK